MGQYILYEEQLIAEVALTVRDELQGQGVGTEIMKYLTTLAVRQGLMGFSAEVLSSNKSMLYVFEKLDFEMEKNFEGNCCEVFMKFKPHSHGQ